MTQTFKILKGMDSQRRNIVYKSEQAAANKASRKPLEHGKKGIQNGH
jgi:hypothetical protein